MEISKSNFYFQPTRFPQYSHLFLSSHSFPHVRTRKITFHTLSYIHIATSKCSREMPETFFFNAVPLSRLYGLQAAAPWPPTLTACICITAAADWKQHTNFLIFTRISHNIEVSQKTAYLVKPGEFQLLWPVQEKRTFTNENKNIWLSHHLKWSISIAFDKIGLLC